MTRNDVSASADAEQKTASRSFGGEAAVRVGRVRHFGGLATAGLVALAVDLGVLWLLIWAGIPALAARLVSITVAMVVSWLINRTVSFGVATAPTLSEFSRFAAVSWTAQAVNYAVFSAALLIAPGIGPTWAVLLGCSVSIFVAYAGFRFAVFAPASTSSKTD